jgi:hypothetical protein
LGWSTASRLYFHLYPRYRVVIILPDLIDNHVNDRTKKEQETDQPGCDELRSVLDQVSRKIPLPASGNELILLEIDPHRAHVCWNIDPQQAHPESPLVLRVFDITEGGKPSAAAQAFDVEVHGLQGRWYLDLWRDNRTFVTQLGYRREDGSIDVLAESNHVSTPPAEPEANASTGQHTDPHGNALNTDWPGDHMLEIPAPDAAPEPVEPPTSPEAKPAPLVVEPITLLDPEFPIPYWPGRSSMSSPVEPAAEEVVASEVALETETATTLRHEPEATAVAAGNASVAFDDEVMNETAEEFPAAEQLVAAVQENRAAINAFYEAVESRPEAAGTWPHEPSGSTPESPSAPASAPDAAAASPTAAHPAPLEHILGLSSLELPGRDVLLEVNAELHIYGRSKPDTELTLYGQIVKTRPDGSFSVRRPLPHGAVILPLLYTKKGDGRAEV